VNDANFRETGRPRLPQILVEGGGNIARPEGMEIERVFDRNPSHGRLVYISSISTSTGIAAFATLEMMQYFSARLTVFSIAGRYSARSAAGTRA